MDLGLSVQSLDPISLPEVIRWSAETGYRSLEIPCLGRGDHWFKGPRLVLTRLDDKTTAELADQLAAGGQRIAALSYHDNLLENDESARGLRWKRLDEVVRAAARLRVPVVSCMIGRDPALRLGDCIARWAHLAEPVVAYAREHDVRLAVEVDPMIGWQFEDMPGNAAFAPQLWEKLLGHTDARVVGLSFDPAPLHWLGVDVLEMILAYAESIFHVVARDVEIFPDRRSDCSVLRPQGGWWQMRLPGQGQLPWPKIISRLQQINYRGSLSVRNEDAAWTTSTDHVKRGLAFAQRYLDQWLI